MFLGCIWALLYWYTQPILANQILAIIKTPKRKLNELGIPIANHLDILVINTVQEIIKLTCDVAGQENASEHHWGNECSSTELNAVWTHFPATFKYLDLRALLVVFPADITAKNMELISWLGLCNSRPQQLIIRNSDWRGLTGLIRRFLLSCQNLALS